MKTGLVLSGGGARGAAHIGVIKALEEAQIDITHIAGTSAGAIVGALYAAGHTWQEMLHFFKEVPIFRYSRYASNKPGFIDTSKFYEDLFLLFEEDNFSVLKKELFIITTDLLKGTETIFQEGELIKPILASAAFPGIFTPIIIDKSAYVDGGVLNNFPVEPLKPLCDKMIGVFVNPLEDITVGELKHSYEVLNRAYNISFISQCVAKFDVCDIIIAPKKLSKHKLFSFKEIDTIFNIGYEAAKRSLKTNKAILHV